MSLSNPVFCYDDDEHVNYRRPGNEHDRELAYFRICEARNIADEYEANIIREELRECIDDHGRVGVHHKIGFLGNLLHKYLQNKHQSKDN